MLIGPAYPDFPFGNCKPDLHLVGEGPLDVRNGIGGICIRQGYLDCGNGANCPVPALANTLVPPGVMPASFAAQVQIFYAYFNFFFLWEKGFALILQCLCLLFLLTS
jgi:hypothetical protein